jgi:hypothetical protein
MMLKMTGVSSALMMVNGASIVYRSGSHILMRHPISAA